MVVIVVEGVGSTDFRQAAGCLPFLHEFFKAVVSYLAARAGMSWGVMIMLICRLYYLHLDIYKNSKFCKLEDSSILTKILV